MARTGVTEAQVADAADALLVAGERPTIERVRTALGTGSPNTLIRHLDAWWTGLGRRLSEKQRQVAIPDAPAEVSDAASAVWRIALDQAGKLANDGLQREREALRSQQALLEAQVATAAEAIENASSATDEARQAVGMAEVRAEGLEKLRDQQQVLIKTLEAELDRERMGSQALKEAHERTLRLLEQTRGQASADREAAAAHIQAVENRAHQEVDRARGETTKATRRVGELDKQVQRLRTESAQRLESLARELRRSEAEAASLKLELATASKPKPGLQAGAVARKTRRSATKSPRRRDVSAGSDS